MNSAKGASYSFRKARDGSAHDLARFSYSNWSAGLETDAAEQEFRSLRPGYLVVESQFTPLGEFLVESKDEFDLLCSIMKTLGKFDWVEWLIALSILASLAATGYAATSILSA